MPHHRWEPGDYAKWRHANPTKIISGQSQLFAKDTWGGTFHEDFQPHEGDVIIKEHWIKEHWAQSGFANSDLDHQLKVHGIEKIIIIGMLTAC